MLKCGLWLPLKGFLELLPLVTFFGWFLPLPTSHKYWLSLVVHLLLLLSVLFPFIRFHRTRQLKHSVPQSLLHTRILTLVGNQNTSFFCSINHYIFMDIITNTHTRSVCRNTNMIKQNLIAQNLGHLKKFFSLWEFKNVHRRREKSIMNPSSHFSHYQHMANHLSPSCMSLTSLPWIILSKSQTLYHFIHDISLCMSQR